MVYKNTFITLGLVIAIGLAAPTTFLSYHPQDTLVAQQAILPDAFMENVTALIMDKQGKPKLKIQTPQMVHYAEGDTTKLKSPQLTIYRQSPQPWYVTSKYAKATKGIETVDFW